MNRFALFALFVLCLPLHAQEPQPQPEAPKFSGPRPSTILRMYQMMFEAEQQGKRLYEHGMSEPGYATLIGLSEAQLQHLEAQSEIHFQEFTERFSNNDLFFMGASLPDEEFNRLENDFFEFYSKAWDKIDETFRETLTPVQLQKALEYELTVPPFFSQMCGEEEGVWLNLSLYEVLDLSEEQKKTMLELQEELNSETKNFYEEYTRMHAELMYKQDMEKMPLEEQKKIAEKIEKLEEKGKAVSKRMREKIEGVLTPEQREKLASIREEIPKQLAAILEKQAKENPVDDSWKDSWKPGDPIPEGMVPPQRKPRFPMGF